MPCIEQCVFFLLQIKNKPHDGVCKCAFILELGADANSTCIKLSLFVKLYAKCLLHKFPVLQKV